MGKIVQICVTGVENTANTQCNYVIVALDENGRVWEMSNTWGWHEVPLAVPDPQDED